MSTYLFDNLDTDLIKLALYRKTGTRPLLTFEMLKNITINELFNLSRVSPLLSEYVYKYTVISFSAYNPSLCEEVSIVEQLDNRKAFGTFTQNEAWLLIYSLVKSDFTLAYKLFADTALLKQFKQKFTERALNRDGFYSEHNHIFLLLESYQVKLSLTDAKILNDVCNAKKSIFSFIINQGITAANSAEQREELSQRIKSYKTSRVKMGFIHAFRFLFGEDNFKETILINNARNVMLKIIKSKPVLKMDVQRDRRVSLPVTSSPQITPDRRNGMFDYLVLTPDINQATGDSTPSAVSSSEDDSPRQKL